MLGRRVLAGLRDQFAGVIVANEGQDDVTGRLTIAPAKRTVILSVSTPSDRWRGGVWMLAGADRRRWLVFRWSLSNWSTAFTRPGSFLTCGPIF